MRYRYDAYGNCTVVDVAGTNGFSSRNPFRYRGYFYDTETGWYLLTSRFYSPEFGRFISPDSIDYLDPSDPNGLNLYTYCGNDPVNYSDPSGNSPVLAIVLSLAIGFAVGAVSGFVFNTGKQLVQNGWDWSALDVGSMVNSAIVGGALGLSYTAGVTFLGPVLAGVAEASVAKALIAWSVTTAISFAAGATGYWAEETINHRSFDFGTAMFQGGIVALEGTIKFAVGGMVGSVGTVGKKGRAFVTKEWWFKLIVGQEFGTPFTTILDLLRKNLFWED